MSLAEVFEISDEDTVWDAWLATINFLDLLQSSQEIAERYDFAEARNKIGKICSVAEMHSIDRTNCCICGLSDAEHAILKRKILTFFKMQLSILKHFVY